MITLVDWHKSIALSVLIHSPIKMCQSTMVFLWFDNADNMLNFRGKDSIVYFLVKTWLKGILFLSIQDQKHKLDWMPFTSLYGFDSQTWGSNLFWNMFRAKCQIGDISLITGMIDDTTSQTWTASYFYHEERTPGHPLKQMVSHCLETVRKSTKCHLWL